MNAYTRKKMVLAALAASCLALSTVAEAAQDFVVRAGQTFVISANTKLDLFYNSMVLEDGATLIVGIPQFHVNVGELKIGNDVRITGNGKDGPAGRDAPREGRVAGPGHTGFEGIHGAAGENGNPGANLSIRAGTLHPIGKSLRVELAGGSGGTGGSGGEGGKGGPAECHAVAGDGGQGGNGNNGGSGGSGGRFSILFSAYVGPTSAIVLGPDTFFLEGGAAGGGGRSGSGGHGGDGIDCGWLLGGARPGGRAGNVGRAGADGRPGLRSLPEVKPI